MIAQEDRDFLFDARRGSYYGVTPFRGRYQVLVDGTFLGTVDTPVQGVPLVVDFLKAKYGWKWKLLVDSRNGMRPWVVKQVLKKWVVYVWVCGVSVRVGEYSTREQAHATRRYVCDMLKSAKDRQGRPALFQA